MTSRIGRTLITLLVFASSAFAQVAPAGGGSSGGVSNTTIVVNATKTTLGGNTNFYVRTDGNDSNSGLANTAGGAWLTLQGAWDNLTRNYISGPYVATVNVADGTYVGNLSAYYSSEMAGAINFVGNVATPANVVLDASGKVFGIAVSSSVAAIAIGGITIDAAAVGFTAAVVNATLSDVVISDSGLYSVYAASASSFTLDDVTISGSQTTAITAIGGSTINTTGVLTVSGTPALAGAFAYADNHGLILFSGTIVDGGATGLRFLVTNGGVIRTGANVVPGDVLGVLDYGTGASIVGSPPVVSACGAAPSVVDGSDSAGRLTVGGGGAVTSCTLTAFNPIATAPFCSVTNETTTQLMGIVSDGTTITITGADFQSDVVSFMCKH